MNLAEFEEWLRTSHQALVDELAAHLDTEAGLADVKRRAAEIGAGPGSTSPEPGPEGGA